MSPQAASAESLLLAKQLLSMIHAEKKLPAYVTESSA